MNAQELIGFFNLKAHPEGGYFKETYRSKGEISEQNLAEYFEGNRNYATGIYFLLTSEKFSAFHKINQDEMWHFYNGTALKLHVISPLGEYSNVIIGNDFTNGEIPQFTVPAHHYFAAEVLKENSFSFVGCTVAPGFDFKDFVLPSREILISEFPKHRDVIERLTHH